jgi:ketosteroid isomerase-like protein
MKKILCVFAVFLSFVAVSNLSAQEWSDAQLEVWETVQAYNDIAATGKAEDFYGFFHETYNGWSYESDVPMGKAEVKKFIDYWFPKVKIHYMNLVPLKIWVMGDYAYVHYVYSRYAEIDGKPNMQKGRWTDILMKVDGNWVMVGDHGGETK